MFTLSACNIACANLDYMGIKTWKMGLGTKVRCGVYSSSLIASSAYVMVAEHYQNHSLHVPSCISLSSVMFFCHHKQTGGHAWLVQGRQGETM